MTTQIPQGAQDYLEAIFEMEEEGATILQARIAERLGVTAATVSQAVGRLAKDGLIQLDGRKIRLTEEGRKVATPLVRRHRLAERLLTDILEIPWYRAHEEAHAWEHVISPEVEQKILEKTGARTCPHGNPIPGMKPPYERSELIPLTELGEGERGTLSLLTEDVELVTGVLKYFQDHGLMPGASVGVRVVGPDGTRTLDVDGKTASLGSTLADNLWVTRN
ncbi:MAG TPA: metal-dependent transcriptional regulator [Actinomycetota bacterium]|jgi:DtxR family Mn-dependent transcriptional regulator|nr:metal-dependent transcriptional regulator [Actinomycetota bacterium]